MQGARCAPQAKRPECVRLREGLLRVLVEIRNSNPRSQLRNITPKINTDNEDPPKSRGKSTSNQASEPETTTAVLIRMLTIA